MKELTQYELICNDLLPLLRQIPATERYAITLGGSHGKGLSDQHSDYDFRVYYDERVPIDQWNAIRKELNVIFDKWKNKGIEIDGAWSRSFSDIDNKLDLWLSGKGQLEPKNWSIWGYTILTDLYNQAIVEDPFGIAANWKARLKTYPDALRNAILTKNSAYISYWRNDYHYISKIRRNDIVFLSSLTCRLIHEIIQIVYALNRFYYPGDGLNLVYTRTFEIKPNAFEDNITAILYPKYSEDMYENQYKQVIELIDEVLLLVEKYS